MENRPTEYTKQLTALDWFLENLPNRFKNAFILSCEEEIEEAKSMMRNQIEKAYSQGKAHGLRIGFGGSGDNLDQKNILANEYYELNFKHK